jgi:hypothetical protein
MTNEMDRKTSYDYDKIKCDLENELKEAIKMRETLLQRRIELKREAVLLDLKIRELDPALLKSRTNIETLKLQISEAKSKYWTVRAEGR